MTKNSKDSKTKKYKASDIVDLGRKGNKIELESIKAKDFSRNTFWHYTTGKSAVNIKNSKYFFVSNFSNMNDLNEAKLYSLPENIFSLCFCNTNTEKIPMWYLYSGITGKGTSIGLTPGKMRDFILSIKEVYPVIEGVVDEEMKIPIVDDNNGFTKEFGWVIYMDEKRGKYKSIFRRSSKSNEPIDYPFIKNYPWEYEREFRIVFKNNTGQNIDRIAVRIPDKILNEFKIMLGPENEQALKDEVSTLGYKKVKNSILNIRMNLLANNKDDFERNIHELYRGDPDGKKRVRDMLNIRED